MSNACITRPRYKLQLVSKLEGRMLWLMYVTVVMGWVISVGSKDSRSC